MVTLHYYTKAEPTVPQRRVFTGWDRGEAMERLIEWVEANDGILLEWVYS